MAELAHRMADESAEPLRAVLDQAVGSGELLPTTDTGVLADALVAPIVMARLFHRPPVAVADIPALVDQILPAVGPLPSRRAEHRSEPLTVDR
jgi:hypothetical protein